MQETEINNNFDTVPLHTMIWQFGRNLLGHAKPVPKPMVTMVKGEGSLQQQMHRLTVQQLTTAMRMHGIDGEDETMLASLEAMALAGEISFDDFIVRMQNLFPRTLDALDASLRMKIAVMTLPRS